MRQKSVESSLAPQGSFSRGWQWIRERRLPLLALALYLVAALWLTWPTVLSPLSEIPIGSEPVATVPLFAVWTMWWNADQLAGMFGNYWNAPIFFPTQDTFALSEPLPGTMIVAPVIWITGSRVLAYNLYLWTSLILNGVFAQRLLKLYGVGTSVAIWGSVAVVLLPIVNWQLGVVHLLSLWGILWTWAAIERMCDKPTRWRGVELGAALGVSAILSFHHGLFLGILLVAAAPTLWRCLIRYRDWPAWLLAVPVALIIAGPFAYPIHKTLQVHGTEWERAWIVEQSAQPSDYLQVYGTTAPNNSWRMLAPGWVKLGLAMIGIVFGIRNVAYRRWAAFLLVIVIAAFLLSLGPNLQLGAWRPWWFLADYVPGLAEVRNVFRFAYFVHLVVVLFAAVGLYGLYQAGSRRWKEGTPQLTLRLLLILLALVALFEIRPQTGRTATVPDVRPHRVWLEFVRENTPAGHGIACFPFSPGNRVTDFQVTADWMYLGTFHGVPLVNGYSTHFPESYMRLRHEIAQGFPAPGVLRQLHEQKVLFLVVRRPPEQKGTLDEVIPVGDFQLRLVCEDEFVNVYRLYPKQQSGDD